MRSPGRRPLDEHQFNSATRDEPDVYGANGHSPAGISHTSASLNAAPGENDNRHLPRHQ